MCIILDFNINFVIVIIISLPTIDPKSFNLNLGII